MAKKSRASYGIVHGMLLVGSFVATLAGAQLLALQDTGQLPPLAALFVEEEEEWQAMQPMAADPANQPVTRTRSSR